MVTPIVRNGKKREVWALSICYNIFTAEKKPSRLVLTSIFSPAPTDTTYKQAKAHTPAQVPVSQRAGPKIERLDLPIQISGPWTISLSLPLPLPLANLSAIGRPFSPPPPLSLRSHIYMIHAMQVTIALNPKPHRVIIYENPSLFLAVSMDLGS